MSGGYAYGDEEPTETCPYCHNDDCRADFVDVGVGNVQCGPFTCETCGAVEIGSYDDPSKPTADEKAVGWYKGDRW